MSILETSFVLIVAVTIFVQVLIEAVVLVFLKTILLVFLEVILLVLLEMTVLVFLEVILVHVTLETNLHRTSDSPSSATFYQSHLSVSTPFGHYSFSKVDHINDF